MIDVEINYVSFKSPFHPWDVNRYLFSFWVLSSSSKYQTAAGIDIIFVYNT